MTGSSRLLSARRRQGAPNTASLLLLLAGVLATERGLRSPGPDGAFALAPPAARGARPAVSIGVGGAATNVAAAASQAAQPLPPSWRLVGSAGALAVALLLRSAGRPASAEAASPLCGVSPVVALQSGEAFAPATVMYTEGGRRKRLGVGGKVCMLTGAKKYRGYYRTFTEKKVKRYWRPNTGWKKIWWEREKKWVRLYIDRKVLPDIDRYGIEHMARKAGLDLYAWCKPHWEPGSRQPLCLKVGYSPKARRDLKFWPDYMPQLNKGQPLSDIMPPTGTRRVDKIRTFSNKGAFGEEYVADAAKRGQRLKVDKMAPPTTADGL